MFAWTPLLALPLPQATVERAKDPQSGRTYVLSAEALSYADAERVARGMGGTLVSIASASEETFLLDHFGAPGAFWIGLEFPRAVWADGTEVEFTHWAPGMPSRADGKPFTVMNWGEPGTWGEAGTEPEERYRALFEFAPGVEPGIVPPLGVARRAKRGVLLVALQGLSAKELQNARLPNLHELFERSAWTFDAGADPSGDALAGLGMLVWGVGSLKSSLSTAAPEKAASQRCENVLTRLERQHPEIATVALFDDVSLSGILLDGRIDLRVPNASARRNGTLEPVGEALTRPTPLCLLAAFTDVALRDEEPSEASRAKEIAAIDQELGTLLDGLRARPTFGEEEWWIALAGLAPSAPKKGKPALEGRARTAVPLVLVAPDVPPGEIRAEVSLADLVPSAMQFLEVAPRASAGLDGRVLRLGERTELGVNLLWNPGAEEQLTYEPGTHRLFPGWRPLGPFRLVRSSREVTGPPDGGQNLFGGGDAPARLEQTLDLASLATEVDRGVLRFALSGWLGSVQQPPATIDFEVEFLNESGKVMATARLGPVGLEERRAALGVERGMPKPGLVERSTGGKIPKRARAARVALVTAGANGLPNLLADSLSFVVMRE